jgi:hypothetical protein
MTARDTVVKGGMGGIPRCLRPPYPTTMRDTVVKDGVDGLRPIGLHGFETVMATVPVAGATLPIVVTQDSTRRVAVGSEHSLAS